MLSLISDVHNAVLSDFLRNIIHAVISKLTEFDCIVTTMKLRHCIALS